MIDEAVARVMRMELCFDILLEAEHINSTSIHEDALLKEYLQVLTLYFESGQWLRDYELDEKGLLPQDLKRGVLAQDAVYNFLDRISSADC